MQSLAPWWLTVDSPFGVTADVLRAVHSRADVAYVASDECNRDMILAHTSEANVSPDIPTFIKAHDASPQMSRPLIGVDMHCDRRDLSSQKRWIAQSLEYIVMIQCKFDLPYFLLSCPTEQGMTEATAPR